MGAVRALQGLVNTLADTFVSRNNDVCGYWALGMLYLEVSNDGGNTVDLALLSGFDSPQTVAGSLQRTFNARLTGYAAKQGVCLSEGRISAAFGVTGDVKQARSCGYGDRFQLDFVLKDTRGRVAVACRTGRCRPHNPQIESRSTRAEGP